MSVKSPILSIVFSLVALAAVSRASITPEEASDAFGTPDLTWTVSGDADGVHKVGSSVVWNWSAGNALTYSDYTLASTTSFPVPYLFTATISANSGSSFRLSRSFGVLAGDSVRGGVSFAEGKSGDQEFALVIPAGARPLTIKCSMLHTLGSPTSWDSITIANVKFQPEPPSVSGSLTYFLGDYVNLAVSSSYTAETTVTGLPSGTGFSNGRITGVPTSTGTFPITLTNSSIHGVGARTVDLQVIGSDSLLAEAVDQPGHWSTSMTRFSPSTGLAPYITHDGVDAAVAMSGNTPATAEQWISLRIDGPAVVRWSKRTTLESGFFGMGSESLTLPSGANTSSELIDDGWTLVTCVLPRYGSQTIRWAATSNISGGYVSYVWLTLDEVSIAYPDSFSSWTANMGEFNPSPDADPDGDGIPNLLEYALGGDPTNGASAPQGYLIDENGQPTLVAAMSEAAKGVTLKAEWSTELGSDSWVEIPNSGTGEVKRFALPAGRTVFARLRAVMP